MLSSDGEGLTYEEIKKRFDELSILYKMTRISTSSPNLDQILTEIVTSLNDFFKFETFGILLTDENTRKLIPHSSSIGLSKESPLWMSGGIPGWVAEKGEPLLVNDFREDTRYPRPDGEILSEMCAPLKAGEKVTGIIDARSREPNAFSENGFYLFRIVGEHLGEITENVRSEERYRAVVESALDGVMVTGEDYRCTFVNERLAEILGYSKDELIGMDFRDYLDEESKQVVVDRNVKRQKGEALSPQYEINVLRKDRRVRNVEVSSTVIKDSQGNTNTVAFVKDITEKRRMEERLFQAEKLRAVGEMASGVAHDFNNALAIILGHTQLLQSVARDEDSMKMLKTIEDEAQQSAQTVRRLLEFTRKGGHQDLYKIDLNTVIRDAVEITKPMWEDEARGKGIHIGMILNLEKIPPVAGVASELREVVINMIINAIEAMPEGGKIEIRTFEGKGVCIQISDTGVGMTEEVRNKIFEPFFTTKAFSNTGLGLSMAYGIVRRFGGEIEVETRVAEGTTFTITLPVDLEGGEEFTDSSKTTGGNEARILVIDDEEFVRNGLSKILKQAKHQVAIAENGKEGILLFQQREFDIVLTDFGMPDMSGWEVCRAIKRISPRTVIGMITAGGTKVDQAKMKESKIDFLISKPFDINQILNRVAETMASKEITRFA